jgi:ribosomal protein S18 acetylase RimI-like enzyme
MNALTVDLIGESDWAVWRELRLAALADAPYAFGSTLAETRKRDEAAWRAGFPADRQGANFVGRLDGTEAGMCAVIMPAGTPGEREPGEPLLVAMWLAPAARGTGLAEALVRAAEKWCVEHDLSRLRLDVVEDNPRAIRLYQRLGYLPTGRAEPLRSDPTKNVLGYARDLA